MTKPTEEVMQEAFENHYGFKFTDHENGWRDDFCMVWQTAWRAREAEITQLRAQLDEAIAMARDATSHNGYLTEQLAERDKVLAAREAPKVAKQPRDSTGRLTSDYEPTANEIRVAREAICREFGNNGTDGYYIRILKAIHGAKPAAPLTALAAHDAKVREQVLDEITMELVTTVLNDYHCIHYTSEDGGLPLVDSLTPRRDKAITRGKEELESLADHIASELVEAIRDGREG